MFRVLFISCPMILLLKDLCSMKVRIGTFHTGPLRNPTEIDVLNLSCKYYILVPSESNTQLSSAILFSDCFKESSENQSLRPESSHWLSPCTRGPPSNWQDQAFHNKDIYLGSATQSTFKSINY